MGIYQIILSAHRSSDFQRNCNSNFLAPSKILRFPKKFKNNL